MEHTDLVFRSPAIIQYQYTIAITEAEGYFTFNISANDGPGAGEKRSFTLNNNDHTGYLDLFEQLHMAFGLRLPQNRRPYITPTFKMNYTEVLLDNISDGMLYGYGDPAIIAVERDGKTPCYYLVCTSNDAPDAFPIIRSENLKDWTFVDYVFPRDKKPLWAANGELVSDYWAPEIHCVRDEYRIYFVARDKVTSELCIGSAKSSKPEGPYAAEAEPILKGNVIDPHLFLQDDRTTYLFWKEDNNDIWPGALINLLYNNPSLISTIFIASEDVATACFMVTIWPWLKTLRPMERFLFSQVFIEAVTERFGLVYDQLNKLAENNSQLAPQIKPVTAYMKTPMFARQLTVDGTAFMGETVKILENDLNWEAHLVEGMWVTKQQDKYYLFYAGNDFSTHQYGIGVAIADAPLGPYHKLREPILQSTEKWLAPGHPSITNMPDGRPIMFLHGYFPGRAGYKQFRALLSVPLRFEAANVIVG